MKIQESSESVNELVNPAAAVWKKADSETISLSPVDIDKQPNAYIRSAWEGKTYGNIQSVNASALTAGDQMFVRLEWQDTGASEGEFASAAAVLAGKSESVSAMGSEKEPLHLWYWAEDRESGVYASASGPGVFARSTLKEIPACAVRADKNISVVIAGPKEEVQGQIGVVVWDGSNDERAGLGAVSHWVSLDA
ncbi:MAG: hypothetical protein OEZ23_09205 [Gammaproteobacteria bacterium]|nr:hypothetical protein [Gammaproteobacteria bacterium]